VSKQISSLSLEQLCSPSLHSSLSINKAHHWQFMNSEPHLRLDGRVELLTLTKWAIPPVSLWAAAVKTAFSVRASGIHVAVVFMRLALIHIWTTRYRILMIINKLWPFNHF